MDWSQVIIILVLSGVISVIIGMIAGIPLSRIILKRREQVSLSKNWTLPESESQDISTDQFDKLLEKYGVPKIKNDKQDSEETLERTLERENDESVTVAEQTEADQESEPKDTIAGQFDKLFEKYSLSKAKEDKQSSEETPERENDESVTVGEQTDSKAKDDKQSREETFERENDESVTVVEQADPMVIDQLLAELEKNHALSAEPRPDKPEPFQTDIWDANSNVPNILTASLKWELTQAYVDISLANNVIWFLKEFGVASPVLSEQYKELCDRISTSLGKVIPILKTGKKIEI